MTTTIPSVDNPWRQSNIVLHNTCKATRHLQII